MEYTIKNEVFSVRVINDDELVSTTRELVRDGVQFDVYANDFRIASTGLDGKLICPDCCAPWSIDHECLDILCDQF